MQFRVWSMTVVVTESTISTLSNASKSERVVLPLKKVLIAGVVYTTRLLTGDDLNWSFSICENTKLDLNF